MSMDPQMIAQLLMQRGQQQPGMAGAGGQPAQAGGANLLQQILAMQQLKQRMGQQPPPQPGQPPGMMAPQTLSGNAMGSGTNV